MPKLVGLLVRAFLSCVASAVTAFSGWAVIEFGKIAVTGIDVTGAAVDDRASVVLVTTLIAFIPVVIVPMTFLILWSEKHRRWVLSGRGIVGPTAG